MAKETGWERLVCDGSSEHCVRVAFAREDDAKSKALWHEREYITKDGEKMNYFFCDACDKEWTSIIADHDRTVNKFIRPEE